jgi:hypothetical protein
MTTTEPKTVDTTEVLDRGNIFTKMPRAKHRAIMERLTLEFVLRREWESRMSPP